LGSSRKLDVSTFNAYVISGCVSKLKTTDKKWHKMDENEETGPVNETPAFIKDVFDGGKQ